MPAEKPFNFVKGEKFIVPNPHEKIMDKLSVTREAVHEKFKEVKANIQKRRLILPQGEVLARAVPRTVENDGQAAWNIWHNHTVNQQPVMLGAVYEDSLGDNRGALMNYHPQAEILHPLVIPHIQNFVKEWFRHLPIEDTLAQRLVKAPMLIGRVDMIDGYITEVEGSASLWSVLTEFQPIAETYLDNLRRQLAVRGFPLHLVEHKRPRIYRHLDHLFLDEINEHNLSLIPYVSTITRAMPDDPGFAEYINTWGPTSIFMRECRDSKYPLVAMGNAVLAPNLKVALDGAEDIINDPALDDKIVVICSIEDSRTEALAIFNPKGTRRPGESNRAQIEGNADRKGKLPKDKPTLIVPFTHPPTMKDEGFVFWGNHYDADGHIIATDVANDAETVTKGQHQENAGQYMIPGRENDYHICDRLFFSIDPDNNPSDRKDPSDIEVTVWGGGIWQASRSKIIHGEPTAVTGGSYIAGVEPPAGANLNWPTRWAVDMMRRNEHLLYEAA